jgi:hypothetical protein
MRAVWISCLVVFALFPLACGGGKKDAGAETASDTSRPDAPARDFAEYVAELRNTVPVRVDEFKAKGLKCDKYETSVLAGIEIFDSLVLTIEPPVTLKDTLTGKTKKYKAARMVRSGNGDVFATGVSDKAAEQRGRGMIPITWDGVTMVEDAGK